MKQIIRFTKSEVLEAIMCEPLILQSGSFFSRSTEDNSCKVCAVSAVLRQRFGRYPKQITTLGYQVCGAYYCAGDDLEMALKTKNYLGALSVYFESSYEEFETDEERRMALYNFVYSTFPSKFTVKI